MQSPRPEKVAVVEELRLKLTISQGTILTEYRGLNVSAMADLRAALREAGGEYKIYKNTLVRLAASDADLDIQDLLFGPTALAFVGSRQDGTAGDIAGVARALRDFARTHQSLVIKGGVLANKPLDANRVATLATLPSREILLAQVAGALASPMSTFAGLLAAVPSGFAYGLKALIEKRQEEGEVTTSESAGEAEASGGAEATGELEANGEAEANSEAEANGEAEASGEADISDKEDLGEEN